jgi:hypothetical protein
MKTSNTHISSLLTEFLTGALLLGGISLVISSTALAMQSQAAIQEVTQSFPTQANALDESLHGAAMLPLIIQQGQTSYLLILGMLLILSAFMLYTIYIVNKRLANEGQSIGIRVKEWFIQKLDSRPRVYHTHLTTK